MRPAGALEPLSSPSPDSLSGLIERVTYHNEETGFAVLRVKAKGHRDLVTVVGSVPAVNAGEWLSAQGSWVRDPQHGLQYRAHALHCSPPSSRSGIEKYLASGLIKGIGPVYAKKMVDHFGEAILDIIDQYSARLEEIDGIGPARRHGIKAAWTEQKAVREIMIFLHAHGVSTSRALRIYRSYGEAAIEKVRANPYALAADIHGIGFKTADQIAGQLGISSDSFIRICASLSHVLLEATGEGHCALPRDRLIASALELLNQPRQKDVPVAPVHQPLVETALTQMIASRQLLPEIIEGVDLVFHPSLQRAEVIVANSLLARSREPSCLPPINLEKAISWCQDRTGKVLSPSQRQALHLLCHHRVAIVTGGPGVGKTTLLDSLLKILRAKKVRCLLCAPTGRAAKRLSEATGLKARTIHRLLEYQPGAGGFSRNSSHPLDCDLLIIDETSMVDVPLMQHLLLAHPTHAHLVLVGDMDQLPSVGPGNLLADLITSGMIPVVRLTEIFRQAAGSQIITSAHQIREGLLPSLPAKGQESDFYFVERDDPAAIAATLLDLVGNRIPKKFGLDPQREVQVLSPMNRGSLGILELNRALQERLNPYRADEPMVERFGWQFRLRDKVIQTENDYDKDVFNGDIGVIRNIDPVEQQLGVDFDGRTVAFDFGELDELSPAYAITIHKAQGSEFPAVVIPLATQHYLLLQRNLIYTAITRGKRLVVVIGQRRALSIAVRTLGNQERYSGLRSRLCRHAEDT
jgi:exodeoxyribonuclease V alpha subunit